MDRLDQLQQRLKTLRLALDGAATSATTGHEWSPLAGVPGVETRLIKDAFLMEARYAPGTESPGVITVPEAVYVLVESGIFWLATDAGPLTPYGAGMYRYLPPGQPHRWRCEGHVLNLLPFVPADYRSAPNL